MAFKRYEIRDNGKLIGVWYAANAKAAISRALNELNAHSRAFKKSGGNIGFRNPVALELPKPAN